MPSSWRMRIGGYAPIEEYAAIGDGRTAALVARDGSIDWLCLPNFDSPSVCGGILDAAHGGVFELHPTIPFDTSRRYLPHTNVLETLFTTGQGSVRVVDALTLPNDHLDPMRELVRSVEGVSGAVPMRWRFAPRFNYGIEAPRCEWRQGIPIATWGSDAVGIASWDAGTPSWRDHVAEASFDIREGGRALLGTDGGVRGTAGLSRARGGHRQARGNDPVLGAVGARARVPGAMGRLRRAERARAEAVDLRAIRRVGGGPDDVAAGSDRQWPQLGLSLLLDPRLEFHHQRVVAARMSPGSAIAVLVVHAGDRLDRAGAPRAVSARRRRRARGADASARRLSGLAAGSRRERRGRAAAARYLRRAARNRVAL